MKSGSRLERLFASDALIRARINCSSYLLDFQLRHASTRNQLWQ
jgi:hypothetical protein